MMKLCKVLSSNLKYYFSFCFQSREKYFFQPEDLYLCQNVARVFETLSALSHSPKVRKSGVPGFPKKEKQLVIVYFHKGPLFWLLTNTILKLTMLHSTHNQRRKDPLRQGPWQTLPKKFPLRSLYNFLSCNYLIPLDIDRFFLFKTLIM